MKKWRCTICQYVHEGPKPPETCPVCGAPSSMFVEVTETAPAQEAKADPPASGPSAAPVAPLEQKGDTKAGIYAISYGLFVVSSKKDGKFNAQTCNTVFQVTSDPERVAIGINKANLTHDFIEDSEVVAITVLGKGNLGHVKRFGFASGRSVDKLPR